MVADSAESFHAPNMSGGATIWHEHGSSRLMGMFSGSNAPPVRWFTKRTAEDWLRGVSDQARRGTLLGMVRTGATFA